MVKNTNKTANIVSKPVGMILKQHRDKQDSKTALQRERVYRRMRARAKRKSRHNYVDLGEEPSLLRLYMLGTKFNSTVEFLVKVGSFKPMMGTSKGTEKDEIGFTVELKSPLIKGTILLEVLRKQFKARLIIPN